VIPGIPTPDDSKVLDLDHLRRQTAGDGALERELLALFEAQCARLQPLVCGGSRSPLERADAAHTLKGSARAVGAWRLALTVDRLETAFRNGIAQAEMTGLMAGFDEALEATRGALAGPGPATAA
jgi:HPt (histidine-containing phosphotransfer) domain-containing protein